MHYFTLKLVLKFVVHITHRSTFIRYFSSHIWTSWTHGDE